MQVDSRGFGGAEYLSFLTVVAQAGDSMGDFSLRKGRVVGDEVNALAERVEMVKGRDTARDWLCAQPNDSIAVEEEGVKLRQVGFGHYSLNW